MGEVQEGKARKGYLFTDAKSAIFEVLMNHKAQNQFFYDGDTRKGYKPINVSILRQNEAGKIEEANQKKEVQLDDLMPLPIRPAYLEYIGFICEEIEGKEVWHKENISFRNLRPHGVQIATREGDNTLFPLISMDAVSQLLEWASSWEQKLSPNRGVNYCP